LPLRDREEVAKPRIEKSKIKVPRHIKRKSGEIEKICEVTMNCVYIAALSEVYGLDGG
jgi:hypothetical protein